MWTTPTHASAHTARSSGKRLSADTHNNCSKQNQGY